MLSLFPYTEIVRGEAMIELLTADEAAAELGLTGRRVRQLLNGGEIIGKKKGRDWIITREALEAYKRKRQEQGKN
jgi:excisionase family DNA binding protein